MTIARKFEIAALIAAVLIGLCLLRGWLQEREARIHAEATQQADDKIISANQDAIKTRDAAAAVTVAALAKQSAAIQTPQQAAQVVLHYLPAPPAAPGAPTAAQDPIPTVDRSQLSPTLQAELPAAPSYAILTQDQLVDQAKKDLACQATGVQLTACQADKANLQQDVTAETATANQWEAAAKGGTKIQRFLKVLKYVGCAGAGAGVGALVDKQSPTIGATVGGGISVAACSLF